MRRVSDIPTENCEGWRGLHGNGVRLRSRSSIHGLKSRAFQQTVHTDLPFSLPENTLLKPGPRVDNSCGFIATLLHSFLKAKNNTSSFLKATGKLNYLVNLITNCL